MTSANRSAFFKHKTAIFFAAAFLLPIFSSDANAQGAAPGMSGVKEVIVQYARFSNPKVADTCGLVREDLSAALNKVLTENTIPSIPVADAKPPMMGVARIELVPEIATLDSQDLDCTSWVSLTAESQGNVRVPPIDTLRNVKIIYWQRGTLLSSGLSTHQDTVISTLKKMAEQFARQYQLDQPPTGPAAQ